MNLTEIIWQYKPTVKTPQWVKSKNSILSQKGLSSDSGKVLYTNVVHITIFIALLVAVQITTNKNIPFVDYCEKFGELKLTMP